MLQAAVVHGLKGGTLIIYLFFELDVYYVELYCILYVYYVEYILYNLYMYIMCLIGCIGSTYGV